MVGLLLVVACSTESPKRLPVELAGCAWVSTGPTCHVADDVPLTLWVASSAAPTRIDGADGVSWEPVQGGYRATVVPVDDVLTVVAAEGRATVRIEPWRVPAAYDATKATGTTDGLLSAHADARGADRAALGWALAAMGHPDWDFARVEREASEDGVDGWAARAALVQAHRATEVTGASRDGLAAVARARAHQAAAGGTLGFRIDYSVDFYEGSAYQVGGNLRVAVAALQRAQRRAERLGRGEEADAAHRHVAESLIRAGDAAAAADTLRALAQAVDPMREPCRYAAASIGYAWGLILIQEASQGTAPDADPEPLLQRALEALDGAECPARHDAAAYTAHANLNLALVASWRGDGSAAQGYLGAADAADPGLDDPWALEIRGRIALLEGDPAGALASFDALADRADEQLELQWMARRGRGTAYARLGRTDDAIAALRDAQALFFRQGLLAPVHLGRAGFYAQRERATALLAQLLLDQGRPQEAFDAFRNQRAQYLVGLHQTSRVDPASGEAPPGWYDALAEFRDARRDLAALGEDWALAGSELRVREEERQALEDRARRALDAGNAALGIRVSTDRRRAAPGEVLLGWFPIDDSWVGFCEHAGRVDVARWPGLALPSAEALLAPFADAVLSADPVTLLPFGAVGDLDLHAADVRGAPLIARVPVRISLDVSDRASAPPEIHAALVIADPGEDLAAARGRAPANAAALRRRGFTVRSLVGRQATRAATLEALAEAQLVDFSGHGHAASGWDSAIEVADGTIGIADVLTLVPAPALVVINACETARETDAGAVGIAQAFVAAGARSVIAPVRPVADGLAARFSAMLYDRVADGQGLAEAYPRAVRELAAEEPHGDWASFRLIEE